MSPLTPLSLLTPLSPLTPLTPAGRGSVALVIVSLHRHISSCLIDPRFFCCPCHFEADRCCWHSIAHCGRGRDCGLQRLVLAHMQTRFGLATLARHCWPQVHARRRQHGHYRDRSVWVPVRTARTNGRCLGKWLAMPEESSFCRVQQGSGDPAGRQRRYTVTSMEECVLVSLFFPSALSSRVFAVSPWVVTLLRLMGVGGWVGLGG